MKKFFTIIALGILILASGDSYSSSARPFPEANIYQSIERAEALAKLTPADVQRILHNRRVDEDDSLDQSDVFDQGYYERVFNCGTTGTIELTTTDAYNGGRLLTRRNSFTLLKYNNTAFLSEVPRDCHKPVGSSVAKKALEGFLTDDLEFYKDKTTEEIIVIRRTGGSTYQNHPYATGLVVAGILTLGEFARQKYKGYETSLNPANEHFVLRNIGRWMTNGEREADKEKDEIVSAEE